MNIHFPPNKPADSIPIGRRALDAGERKSKVSPSPTPGADLPLRYKGVCYFRNNGKRESGPLATAEQALAYIADIRKIKGFKSASLLKEHDRTINDGKFFLDRFVP